MNSERIRVILCGLGVVGSELARILIEKKDFNIVGAVRKSKETVGMDLGPFIGLEKNTNIAISTDAIESIKSLKADIVLDATTRHFKNQFQIIKASLESGKNVISAGEEAAYPWTKNPLLARQIDELAKSNNVSLLGTGTVPAFMTNYLPITLTGLLNQVNKIIIRRTADASNAGPVVWREYAYGEKVNEALNQKIRNKEIGGITWREQSEVIARAMDWTIDEYEEISKPMISKSRRVTETGAIAPGTCCGINQKVYAFSKGQEIIHIDYALMVQPNSEEDGREEGHSILIEGDQIVEATISCRDVFKATAAIIVNSIPHVLKARPGILAADELPPSACYFK